MFADYLNLDDKQKEKLNKWLETITLVNDPNEDCSMAGPMLSFHYYPSGIGDVIFVMASDDDVCNLSYDDNGELVDEK